NTLSFHLYVFPKVFSAIAEEHRSRVPAPALDQGGRPSPARRLESRPALPGFGSAGDRYFDAAGAAEFVCPDMMVAVPSCFSSTFKLNGVPVLVVAAACMSFSAPFCVCMP